MVQGKAYSKGVPCLDDLLVSYSGLPCLMVSTRESSPNLISYVDFVPSCRIVALVDLADPLCLRPLRLHPLLP